MSTQGWGGSQTLCDRIRPRKARSRGRGWRPHARCCIPQALLRIRSRSRGQIPPAWPVPKDAEPNFRPATPQRKPSNRGSPRASHAHGCRPDEGRRTFAFAWAKAAHLKAERSARSPAFEATVASATLLAAWLASVPSSLAPCCNRSAFSSNGRYAQRLRPSATAVFQVGGFNHVQIRASIRQHAVDAHCKRQAIPPQLSLSLWFISSHSLFNHLFRASLLPHAQAQAHSHPHCLTLTHSHCLTLCLTTSH